MQLKNIYLRPNSAFSKHINDWAGKLNIQVTEHEFKIGDQVADGLLVINQNQDINKETYAIHSFFDEKHLPIQKIDVNGTLQVAITSFEIWLKSFKCKDIYILGNDELIKNSNLDRFLNRVEKKIVR